MTLRLQSTNPKKAWTLDELRAGFEKFKEDYGKYPTAPEVDTYFYLPSARSIERSYGGLVALRAKLQLDGQTDFRMGAHSTARAQLIGKRANTTEMRVYTFLCDQFRKEYVHREYFFTDDARTRSDFFVYDAAENFCIDVFYPSNYRNLTGCLNSKLQKYDPAGKYEYPVIFLQMNDGISQEDLDRLLTSKKKKLGKNQYLMGWEAFESFCKKRKARS